MDIIDFHAHFFPDELAPKAITSIEEICSGEMRAQLDGTKASLITGMKEAGITYSVTLPVATKVEQVISINRNLPHNTELIPFGALHPDMENVEDEITFLVERGVKGIKLHPEYQNFYITDEKYQGFFKALSDAELLVMLHTGDDPGPFSGDHATPEDVVTLHRQVPNLKIIAAHFGGFKMWNKVFEVLAGEDIWLDTSAIIGDIDKKLFMDICNKHDYQKILFGTDTPWFSQKESIDFIVDSGLSEPQKEAILGKNGALLLGLLS